MGGLSEDLWTSYVSLGKLQRRMMTVLYILSLREKQRATLQDVLEVFSDVFQDKPGRTSVIDHAIETGSAQPVPLRLVQHSR